MRGPSGVVSCVLLLAALGSAAPAQAELASPAEMRRVCENWLADLVYAQGSWAGARDPGVSGANALLAGDTLLAISFDISPRGHIVVPALKELPPIQAYSEAHDLDVSETGGIAQLLRDVLGSRFRMHIARYGDLETPASAGGGSAADAVMETPWDRLALPPADFSQHLAEAGGPGLREHGPLLETEWHQVAPYNYNCPMGDGGQCIVGCVATAPAQIMKYWEWPPSGSGEHCYDWDGDQSCGGDVGGGELCASFGDAFDWENMPADCEGGCSPEQEAALAELSYEVGIALDSDYGFCLTVAWPAVAMTALPTYFGYEPCMAAEWRYMYTADSWFELIRSEVSAGRPMIYTFYNPAWGHVIVCDGWRIIGELNQYHMNYGWGGSYSGWYTIDEIAFTGDDPMDERLIHGIMPAGGAAVREIAPASPAVLWAPFPNPAYGALTIPFHLAAAGYAKIEIFGPTGRLVRTLHDRHPGPGRWQVTWDARDRAGEEVPSGAYCIRLQVGGESHAARALVIR